MPTKLTQREKLILRERVGGMSRRKVARMFGTTQACVERLERKLVNVT